GLDEVGPRPALILLSLQPDHDDHRLLQTIKASPMLRHTPIVVLTRSRKISDMLQSIDLYASSCVLKPNIDDDFRRAIRAIRRFWLELTVLPLPGVPR
ncbi:MAG: chemotaxis family two-component system response regulator Rcp1, partial [Myxococcota bacterium]